MNNMNDQRTAAEESPRESNLAPVNEAPGDAASVGVEPEDPAEFYKALSRLTEDADAGFKKLNMELADCRENMTVLLRELTGPFRHFAVSLIKLSDALMSHSDSAATVCKTSEEFARKLWRSLTKEQMSF